MKMNLPMARPPGWRGLLLRGLSGGAGWAWLAATVLTPVSLLAEDNPAVTAVNQFGLSCQRLTTGNSLISPWSLQQSLGPAYAGAAGEPRVAQKPAQGYAGDEAKLFEAFKVLAEDQGRATQASAIDEQRLGNRVDAVVVEKFVNISQRQPLAVGNQ